MSPALSASQQQLPVPTEQDTGADWKQQLAERVDAYRAKHTDSTHPTSHTPKTSEDSRASKIARSVASRYAVAPTYRELMLAAAQAEREALAAQAAEIEQAERAEALRQQEAAAADSASPAAKLSPSPQAGPQNGTPSSSAGEQAFRERYGSSICTQPATPVMPQFAVRSREMHLHQAAHEPEPSLEDLLASALVEPRAALPSKLIEFPRELVSSHRARPRLPENPQVAENATHESSSSAREGEPSQLRIFEVQPEEQSAGVLPVETDPPAQMAAPPVSAVGNESGNIRPNGSPDTMHNPPRQHEPLHAAAPTRSLPPATQNVNHARNASGASLDRVMDTGIHRPTTDRKKPAMGAAPPPVDRELKHSPVRAFKGLEWAAISLDKEPAAYSRKAEVSAAAYVPFLVEPASIDRRVMAFAVDFAAVTAGFLGFLVVFAASTPHLPTGLTAVALAGAVYASLWVLYQMLFFSLSGATAGMMYARIAVCTFDDQNPTRSALRRRLGAWWLSCLPLGMGFLWCFVDEDNLCWHDRMTGMYLRGY